MSKFIWAKVILVTIVAIGGFLFGEILETEAASSDIIINEVAFKESNDWIELKVITTGNYDGYRIYEGGTLIATLTGWGTLSAGDYIVIHQESGTNDSNKSDNNPNYWDTYGAGGLTGTDNIIQIKKPPGDTTKIDVVIWSNNDGNFTGNKTEANAAVTDGMWNGGASFSDTRDCDAWTDSDDITEGFSLGRDESSTDTNSKIDWTRTALTPGEVNSLPPPNQPPVANAGQDQTVNVNETIIFDGSGSEDPDGEIESFNWDFGDDTTDSGETVEHSYSEAGNYTVTLTVTDNEGAEDLDNLIVIVIQPTYSNDIIINEFLPNPEGSDSEGEWIEIYNKGSATVDLSGWQLDDIDGGSSPYTIPDGTSIEAGQYLVFYRQDTGLALNNDEDTVRLLYPDGNVTSSVGYAEYADEDIAYARDSNDSWSWTTTPTPGEQNLITSLEDKEEENEGEESDEESEEGESKENPKELSISDVKGEEKGVWVKIKGIVTCPPGVLSGSIIFYIQDEKAGIKIYSSKEDLPEIKLGDEIQVLGKVSEAQGEKKINLASIDDVVVLGSKEVPKALSVKTGEIGEDLEGMLVTISGKIVSTHGSTFYIDDGSGKIKVYIKKSTGIDKPKMSKEDEVTITGIVSEAYESYRILPRFQEDVKMGKVKGAADEKLTKTGTSFWQIIVIACLIMSLCCLLKLKVLKMI